MYRKLRCFSTQVLQDLLITGLWPGKKKIMKKVANSFQIQNSEKNLQSLDILMNTHGY